MAEVDFIHEQSEFMPLWQRARKNLDLLRTIPLDGLLFFDSIDLQTQKLFELIRYLLALKASSDFAMLVMKPDPFNYFHFHFGKYPGFIQQASHTDDDFFEFLLKDPGDSPADALGVNSEHYVVMPLPGDWIVFGDRSWGRGVLYGPPDIMECARHFYPYFLSPPDRFRIDP